MKLNNRFIFGILSLVLAAVIAFVALPTIARQTNGKAEIVRITQPVLKGEKITSDNAEVVEVGGYNLPSNVAHSLSDVEGLYVTADLAEGDYILTSKVSSVPVSSDVALNDIPSGKVAMKLFHKDRRTDYESRVMRLAHQALLSTAEIIKCVEQDVFSLPSERVLMEKVYGDSETTCQNIASMMKNSRSSQAVTLAVANLYLRQQIIFERIST